MSTNTPTPYTPLYDPATESHSSWVPPLDLALATARERLAESATANIHDRYEMLRAAVHLEYALRKLVISIDKEAER